MNPVDALLQRWHNLGLLKRLVAVLCLLIFLGESADVYFMVRDGGAAYRSQHREQAREISQTLSPLLAEQSVIGDFATMRQQLDRQVRDRLHVERIDWIGANNQTLSVESRDISSRAPRWFAALADIPALRHSSEVTLGGQNYGKLHITFTPAASENALWSRFTGQVTERAMVMGILLIAIILILRGNLATVDRLAKGAFRFSRGEHDIRIPAHGAPEIRAAAHAFNNMAEQIGNLVASLSDSRQALDEQLHFVQELVEALPNPVYFMDRNGIYLGVNKAWESFYGIKRADIVGKTTHTLHTGHPALAAHHAFMDQVLWDKPGQQRYEAPATPAEGAQARHMIYNKATFTRADGTVAGLIGMMVDITDHKNAQDALRRSQERLAEAQRIARIGNWERNLVNNELHWSDEVYRIFGLGSPDKGIQYDKFLELIHPEDRPAVLTAVERALHKREPYFAEYRILRPDTTERVVQEQGEVTFDTADNPVRMIGTVQDITEHKQDQARLSYLAYYDTLTGLPNRVMLMERLQQAIAESHRTERLVAVMFLDLDRFKFINDTLGHEIGDALLRMAADRLSSLLRPGDTVSRYGGDEFTLVLANVAHVDDVTRIAQKILERFSHPFRIGGRDLFVTSSVGITLYPLDDNNADNLLKNADAAMYDAKGRGRNTFQFYTSELNTRAIRRFSIETGLRLALERQEFSLHYQPQLDLSSGRLYGMEALLRWNSQEFGSVSPAEFIPLAEEIGLIQPIGEWVLRTACRQAKSWHDAGFPDLKIGVNLSARQFQQADLLQIVRQSLLDSGLEPHHLDLEITEGMLMHDIERTVSTLTELDALGITLSVDDFGTGYSSLSYLKRFPIGILKIDRSFVRDITSDPDDAAIVTAIISMAHGLNIKVVAEGVETQEQQEFLKQNGCNGMQGYYFSKPVPAELCLPLLRQNQQKIRSQTKAELINFNRANRV